MSEIEKVTPALGNAGAERHSEVAGLPSQPSLHTRLDSQGSQVDPKPESNIAAKFLLGLHEAGDVYVFTKEGGMTSHKCPRGTTQSVVNAVERGAQRKLDVYYFPASATGEWPGKTTPTKGQTKESSYVWCELDPEKGETFDEARTRIFGMSWPADVPLPTFDVDSGGGRQFLWKLAAPVTNTECEAINRWLISKIPGCDPARVNVNSLLRVPGTVNWANPQKVEKNPGRVPQLARLVENGFGAGATLPASAFGRVEAESTARDSKRFEPRPSHGKPVELHELQQVPEWVRTVIAQGEDAEGGRTFPSRSEAVYAVLCALARANVSEDTAFSIITDRRFKLSEAVFTTSDGKPRRDWQRNATRQVERAYEEAFDDDLAELNAEFAVVKYPKPRVVSFQHDEEMDREFVALQSFDDFKNAHLNRFRHFKVDAGDGTKKSLRKPLALWWLQHVARRDFDKLVFVPGVEVTKSLNLWRGFAVPAVQGDCSSFLDFVRDTICSGVQEHFDYLVRWMAHAVQRPNEVGHVAVAIRGDEGYGKTFFAESFGSLFGRHCVKVSQPEHLTGHFNSHLQDCLVLVANEAFFAGDKKHASVLKSLVTDETLQIERKYFDVEERKNRVHLILTSNAEWLVPAGINARRFLVLDVAANHVEDTVFFNGLRAWLDNGGRSHLLHYLQTLDLSDFNVRRAPKTLALAEQQVRSMPPEDEWVGQLLDEGVLPGAKLVTPNRTTSRSLFDDARQRNPKLRHYSDAALANVLKRLGVQRKHSGQNFWVFPPLEELRAVWREKRPWWRTTETASDVWTVALHEETYRDVPF